MGNSPSQEEYDHQDFIFNITETCSLLINELELVSSSFAINLGKIKKNHKQSIEKHKNDLFEAKDENQCLREEISSVTKDVSSYKERCLRLEKIVEELHEELIDRREDKQNITEEFNKTVDEVHHLKETLGERIVTLQAVRSALTKEKQKTRALQQKLKKNL